MAGDAHALLHGSAWAASRWTPDSTCCAAPVRTRQPDAQQLLSRALVRQPDPHLARGAARLPVPGEGSLDLAYLTEVDPLWADDELTAILNPEAVLFANAPAKAACVPTVWPATAGMPMRACSGRRLPGARSTR